jgi:hypothetical protein
LSKSKEIIFIRVNLFQLFIHSLVGALAKNGSFGFLSVGLCVGKNQMCHLWVGFFTLTDNVFGLGEGGV